MFSLKKLLIIFSICFLNCSMVFAYTDEQYLSIVEESLFNTTYKNETLTSRITRVEGTLFGKNFKGNQSKRISYIKKTIGVPKITQPAQMEDYPTDSGYSKYPTVSKIETKLYSKTYEQEDIYKRLNRLEGSIFKQTSNAPLSDRVDKLKTAILGQHHDYSREEVQTPRFGMSISEELARLEMQILNAKYMNENVSNRLVRLETKLFGSTSSELSNSNRLERIKSVANAQSSSSLMRDNQQMRKYQDIQTGVGIGSIILMIISSFL